MLFRSRITGVHKKCLLDRGRVKVKSVLLDIEFGIIIMSKCKMKALYQKVGENSGFIFLQEL